MFSHKNHLICFDVFPFNLNASAILSLISCISITSKQIITDLKKQYKQNFKKVKINIDLQL